MLSIPAFILSIRNNKEKKPLDNTPAPSPSDELTAKEKSELDSYINSISADELTLINVEPPKDIAHLLPNNITKKPKHKPRKDFLREACKHGIKSIYFICDGNTLSFTPEQLFLYGYDYRIVGVCGYVDSKNHNAVYAIKYHDLFCVILRNGEEVPIPNDCFSLSSVLQLTIIDFKY